MQIKIGEFDRTECWDGVFYKKTCKLPGYFRMGNPKHIGFWALWKKQNGRVCFIEADHDILKSIEDYKRIYESGKCVKVPEKITECIDCPKYKGCMGKNNGKTKWRAGN